MKILTANLKLLYQNREMFAWYFVCGISLLQALSFPVVHGIKGDPFNYILITPVLVLSIFGSTMGRLVANLWSKPIIFCIPRQINTTRNLLLLIGIAATVILFLIVTSLPYWTPLSSLSVMIALLSFYFMIYSLTVITSIRFNKLIFVLIYLILFIMPIFDYLRVWKFIKTQSLNNPLMLAGACLTIILLIYYAPWWKFLARSRCGSPWVKFFIGWEPPGSKRYIPLTPKQDPHVERFAGLFNSLFIENIRKNKNSLSSPYLLGRIYVILGYFLSNWQMVFFMGIVILLISHFKFILLLPFLFSFAGLLAGHICIMSGSDIFLPLSRRGRLVSDLSALITALFIMFVLGGAFMFFSKVILNSIMSFTNERSSIEVILFNSNYLLITMILLAMTCGLLILFRRKPILFMLLVIVISACLVGGYYLIVSMEGYTLNIYNACTLILTAIMSFGFYLPIIL